jgi:hypothetical protein
MTPNLPKARISTKMGNTDVGEVLIIQKDDVEGRIPTINPTGGVITITLDLTHDKGFKLDFFDIQSSGGTIVLLNSDGDEVGRAIKIEESEGLQSKVFEVNGIYQIVVTLSGPGALAQMNVCRNPEYTPSPVGFLGLAPPSYTLEPTAAPPQD